MSSPVELRVLSYNVRSLRDGRSRVASVIRACEPHVVCVQEAPRLLRWRSTCAALARESGLVVVTGGRTAAAMLILADLGVRVVDTKQALLSRDLRRHQRGLAMAVLELAGRRFRVASMHLDGDPAERRRHLPEVEAHVAELGTPLVLAGDLNEEPGGLVWQGITSTLVDAWSAAPRGDGLTNPARTPTRRIDAVFVSRDLEVVSCGVPDVEGMSTASDHLPVLAVVRLP